MLGTSDQGHGTPRKKAAGNRCLKHNKRRLVTFVFKRLGPGQIIFVCCLTALTYALAMQICKFQSNASPIETLRVPFFLLCFKDTQKGAGAGGPLGRVCRVRSAVGCCSCARCGKVWARCTSAPWSPLVTFGHLWSPLVTFGHLWSLVFFLGL